MKKALILGKNGQDGQLLSELLYDEGYRVLGDGVDILGPLDVIREVDEIYNLAAPSRVSESFKHPDRVFDVVVKGTLNVLEHMRKLGRHHGVKLFHASSAECYGQSYSLGKDSLFAPAKRYQDEDTPFQPRSPYAIAKLAAHQLVENYRVGYKLFACNGILFNHESETRDEHFVTRKITKWIGEFKNWSDSVGGVIGFNKDYICGFRSPELEHTFPKLRLGNIDVIRDWGYAPEYVKAMHMMLKADRPRDYAICTGKCYSIRDFLDTAFDWAGIKNWEDYVVIDPNLCRPVDVNYLCGCNNNIKYKLGWSPRVSFKKLVHKMVDYDTNEAKLRRSTLQKV